MLRRIAACTCAVLVALPPAALAAPSGEVVVEGHAEFHRDGSTTTIDTATEQTIVEYDSFDILPDEAVQINQPTDASRILNHVPHSGDPTVVDGSLSSNGYVYIINPAGVFAGGNAIIDVGGLVAAAGKLDYEDFLAGEDRFTDLSGDVRIAAGAEITARDAVALVGRRVENFGTIVSEAGMVAFVAGENAVLGSLDGHMIVRVDEASAGADASGEPLPAEAGFALTQGGLVASGGGGVVLSAGDTYSLALNHTGVTRGTDVRLEAGGDGLVQVAGEIDASDTRAGAAGGRVQVLGDRVAILDARIDASGAAGGGEILVGGGAHGEGDARTARRTFVGSEAELVADAISEGDGGKIVVWADEKTGFYGGASARGGARSGDGGFIEISGREYLDTGGHQIDLSAPNGRSGTLLYDPEVIEIRGGGPPPETPEITDGSDAPDTSPTTVVGDTGVAGRILTGTDGDGSEPFVIYESEIEGTDANIILEALRQVAVSEDADFATFDNQVEGEGENVVVVMDGNSLVVRVTGDGPEDDFAIDLGPEVTWRVSGGGIIYVETVSGDLSDPGAGPRGDIQVGTLEWERELADADGILIPQALDVDEDALGVNTLGNAVTINTQVGDIVVAGGIDASGPDADAADEDMGTPAQLAASATGLSAGSVRISADSGDIDVGSVQARGGNAIAPDEDLGIEAAPSNGGDGGDVTIFTNDGSVTVRGEIDTSGGDGFAGFVDVPEAEEGQEDQLPLQGNGGFAGNIFVSAVALEAPTEACEASAPLAAGCVLVEADLTARGGSGESFLIRDGQTFAGFGASGGSIQVNGEHGLFVQGVDADPVRIDASGGTGPGGGGDTFGADGSGNAVALTAGSAAGTEEPDPEAANAGVQLDRVEIAANGGDADTGGPGGGGGLGGIVFISANSEAVTGQEVSIQADGGDGVGAVSGEGLRPGAGGAAGRVRIFGEAGVSLSGPTAGPESPKLLQVAGGDGVNAGGGRGGSVDIDASEGDVALVGDVDVSGGDATREDPETGAVAGGAGGSIQLTTGTPGSPDPPAGGDIVLSGRLTAFGGSGDDGDGGDTVTSGGNAILTADGAITTAPGSDAQIFATGIGLTASSIGGGDPVDPMDPPVLHLGGTDTPDDVAVLTTDGAIDANVVAAAASDSDPREGALERVIVEHESQLAETHLTTTANGLATEPREPMLDVVAAVQDMDGNITDLQTVELMDTDADDPSLHFTLDTVEGPRSAGGADLQIDRDAVALGSAGGSITNDDGAIVGEAGTGRHIAITGDPDEDVETVLALDAITIGTEGVPIEIDGDGDADLILDAAGDVYVDVLDPVSGGDLEGFGAIDLVLADATATAFIETSDGTTTEWIGVCDASLGDCDPSDVPPDLPTDELAPASLLTGSTEESGTSFSFDLTALAPSGAEAPRIDVRDLVLGGDGRIAAPGDVRLVDADGPSITFGAGQSLVLEAGAGERSAAPGDIVWTQPGGGDVAIQQVPGDGSGVSEMALVASRGSVGDADGGDLVTSGVPDGELEVAGLADGDFRLRNEDGGTIVITEHEVQATPRDRFGEGASAPVAGITTSGADADVSLDNGARAIVLGEIPMGATTEVVRHVRATGDVTLEAGAVEIENAQYVQTPAAGDDGLEEGTPVALNRAGILAGGDVRVAGTIDTSAGSIAVDDVSEEDPLEDVFVHADLVVDARGDATYEGDVGGGLALATFDTTDAIAAGDVDGDGIRSFDAGEAIFRGRLDGPQSVAVTGDATALALAEDPETSASFGGDVGARTALGALTVEADRIAFAVDGGGSAERVVAEGDIRLGTGLDEEMDAVPAVATITDAAGNLSIRSTTGSLIVGELDKLSAVGHLAIRAADEVHVGDLSASSIDVTAPTIRVRNTRGPADVLLPDGTTGEDQGVDWVANDIAISSAPIPDDDLGSPLRFFLGSGGISVPGGIDAYEVRRIDEAHSAVGRGDFFGPDGEVLDLTGDGPPLVADASGDTPRPEPSALPETLPRFGSDPPAPRVPLGAAEVLAFLRCSGAGGDAASGPGACTAQDAATLAGVRRLRDTALATPRAEEITERYRELVAAPGAVERLRGAFAQAGAAFAATREWRDGTLDGAAFYRFLRSAPREQRAALAAMDELAWLHAELALLGVDDEDTRRLQRTLAQDFADAAGLTGLSADAVTAAVEESPIGLPGKR